MRIAFIVILVGCLPLSSAAQEEVPMTRERAIQTLRSAERLAPDRGMAAARALVDALQPGDYEAWTRVAPVLELESVHLRIRHVLLDAFIRNADARVADALLSMALGWSETNQREALGEDGRLQSEWNDWSSIALLPVFMQRLSEPPLRDLIGRSEGALRLIWEVALGSGVTPGPREAALDALVASPASADRKAQVAMEIILGQPRSGQPDGRVAKTLRPENFPTLRQALAQSGNTAETVHWGAMSALAHFGDVQSHDLLLAKQHAIERDDWKQAQMIRYYLWQIDVQNPPSGLLEHVAEPEDNTRPHNKHWALRRAVELGLPREDIRRAIFDYARTVQPERRKDYRGEWRTVRPGLVALKSDAVELGILSPNDLPDVPYSELKPTP